MWKVQKNLIDRKDLELFSSVGAKCLMLSAYPENSGKRRWVFPGGHALAWPTCLKADFVEIPPQTAGTATGTGRGSLTGRWRVMMRN